VEPSHYGRIARWVLSSLKGLPKTTVTCQNPYLPQPRSSSPFPSLCMKWLGVVPQPSVMQWLLDLSSSWEAFILYLDVRVIPGKSCVWVRWNCGNLFRLFAGILLLIDRIQYLVDAFVMIFTFCYNLEGTLLWALFSPQGIFSIMVGSHDFSRDEGHILTKC
jgi:hypothetical protein